MDNVFSQFKILTVNFIILGIRSKLFTLERNVRTALDDRPPSELPTTAPTPPFLFKQEKTEANKVFKLPKLPIVESDVFEKFEQDLSYRKFYDLVVSIILKLLI